LYTFTAFGVNAAKNSYVDPSNGLVPFDATNTPKNTSSMQVTSKTTTAFNPYSGSSTVNNLTFTRQSAISTSLGSTLCSKNPSPSTTAFEVKGNKVTVSHQIDGKSAVSEFSNVLIQQTKTPDASGGYNLNYYTENGGYVHYYIGSAFCTGKFDISINTVDAYNSALYGIVPYVDPESSKLCLEAYKFVNTTNENLYKVFNSNTTTPNVYGQNATKRYTKLIPIPDVSFNGTPFNLQSQRAKIALTDVSSASWNPDQTFQAEELDFNLTSLSTFGNRKIANLVNITGLGSLVNVKYMYMPDILQARSADGSSIFRLTYNGSVASTLVSTAAVTLNSPVNNFANMDTNKVNTVFGNYEVDTLLTTAPDSNNVVNKPPNANWT
jgi:hypothetical protein